MNQESVTGGFGERVLDRVVVRDTFVPAEERGVMFSEEVEYYSGGIGGVKHTSPLSVYNRWDEDDDRTVRSVGVDPSVFLKLYVPVIDEQLLIRMEPSELIQFGEFSSLCGRFCITERDLSVKVTSDTVEFEQFGSFVRVKDVTDIRSYKSFVSDIGPHSVFDKSYKCGEKVEENLWKAWAKENDLYSGLWTVDKVDDSDTSNLVSLSVTPDGCSETLEFSFSIDEWDENPSMRKLVDTVGSGLVSNIENEVVWVSMGDAISADPVAVSGPWGLYCPSQKPNIVSRFMDRWNWI